MWSIAFTKPGITVLFVTRVSRLLKTIAWLILPCAIFTLALHDHLSSKNVHAGTAHPTSFPENTSRDDRGSYGPPLTVGRLKNGGIVESSGITASRISPGVYWTHNDSGDGPYIFAFNARGGSVGVWRVAGAEARDWEDIAAGPGPQPDTSYLYIGDIGDNSEERSEIVVYRVPEPAVTPTTALTTKPKPATTLEAEEIRLRYPDGKHDAETLMVHPVSGNLFVITKVFLDNPTVYEASAPLNTTNVTTLKRVTSLRVPSLLAGVITGGSISPDGRRVALCDYLQGYEIVLPSGASSFDEIWKQKFISIDLGRRKQGEAITYRMDGKALLTTSEGRFSPLIQVVRK